MQKGLNLNIYRWNLGECSNKGISSKVNKVTLVEFDGKAVVGPSEPSEEAPAVKIVGRDLFGHKCYHAEPIERPPGSIMMGGTFVYACDSRFRELSDYPIPLHDRIE